MSFSTFEQQMMSQALELARKGLYSTSPNPKVGCVIVQNGEIVGQGWHEKKGEPHAEVFALRQAADKAQGATVFVTLEPCSHFGATPPCAATLINAGIKKVIASSLDPNPLVSGNGVKMLQNAGVEVAIGLLEKESRVLNRGFFSIFERQKPFVTLKIAQSLDGKTALNNGVSQWITGEMARIDVHRGRAASCAILTGIGTVIKDNPELNVRHIATVRQPIRIVADSHLQTPANAKICTDGGRTILACLPDFRATKTYPECVEILPIMPDKSGQHIDLSNLMQKLAEKQIGQLWVEAGSVLNGALLNAGLVDEIIIYQAPMILGDCAKDAFRLPEITALNQAHRLIVQDIQALGNDIKITLRIQTG
ncbi:MAG: bifunctional diaminohydroxyphosphoribosylaminopyrimidine deaminase/5-amino-6-(5-phosphoribosylamino)uracil reductase RibD [Neisseriaceae bacterium]|nr:bifunctional diaminohydroxyphosphoribosylaminopyrimidine deaminase/5-amino-6-(5-phosphoribosylamino)uracil reductase RibD [Neisseriaceae bacterium]